MYFQKPFPTNFLKHNFLILKINDSTIIDPFHVISPTTPQPASARGIGIRVVHKWSQIPKRKAVVVQRYLHKPFLINGSKFDLRIYVYVPCYDPLRIYIFQDGLARFATMK